MSATLIIEWNVLSLEEWQKRFGSIPYSTILQSYHYVQAIAKKDKQRARWGLIKIDGQEAGLVQIQEAGILWNAIHAVILDRGPLWFEGFGGAAHVKLFFDEFNRQFPNRFGRKRRILPEIEGGATAEALLQQTGLIRKPEHKPYETLWWDLEQEPLLKANWSGSLKKAQRADLTVQWDDKGKFYSDLRTYYAADKAARGFGGASPQLLDALAQFSTQANPMIIGKASQNGSMIAGVMFLKHGQSATYQVGWSSEEGRRACAHHLLLYDARTVLQNYGVKQLDLGGVNDDNEGLKKFKQGTGARFYRLVGFYT